MVIIQSIIEKYVKKTMEWTFLLMTKTEEIWSHEKLSAEEVIYSVVSFFKVYVSR